MDIIESTNRNIDIKQFDNLFEAVGWNRRGYKKWKEVLSKSYFVYSLWDNKQLVGLGRIMEDGVMCMFYDIAVHPDYQGKKLGKKIMDKLIGQIKNKKYASIGLFAWKQNPNNISFYEKFGFVRKGSGMELDKHMKPEY